jgi:hypothetical protein
MRQVQTGIADFIRQVRDAKTQGSPAGMGGADQRWWADQVGQWEEWGFGMLQRSQEAIVEGLRRQREAAGDAGTAAKDAQQRLRAELDANKVKIDELAASFANLSTKAAQEVVSRISLDDQASASLRNIIDLGAQIHNREIVQRVRVELSGFSMAGLTSGGSYASGGSSDGPSEVPSPGPPPDIPDGDYSPRAAGGPVNAWEPYLVGEYGPELFVPRRGGVIVPADTTRRIAGSGPTVRAQVTVPVYGAQEDPAVLARRVAREVAHQLERLDRDGKLRLGRR